MLLKTISKPTHTTCEKGLHRPDGLATYYHARKNSAGQKRGPKLGCVGPRTEVFERACRNPPVIRLLPPYWPSKRGEHSAGPALLFAIG